MTKYLLIITLNYEENKQTIYMYNIYTIKRIDAYQIRFIYGVRKISQLINRKNFT